MPNCQKVIQKRENQIVEKHRKEMTLEVVDKKPPSPDDICRSSSTGVCSSSGSRCGTWFPAMAAIQYLPSPNLASRFRNNLAVLETDGWC